jgi:hypothetical protein
MFRGTNQAIKQYPRRLQETARDAHLKYSSYVTAMPIYSNDATHLINLCDNATDVRRNGKKLAARIFLFASICTVFYILQISGL